MEFDGIEWDLTGNLMGIEWGFCRIEWGGLMGLNGNLVGNLWGFSRIHRI